MSLIVFAILGLCCWFVSACGWFGPGAACYSGTRSSSVDSMPDGDALQWQEFWSRGLEPFLRHDASLTGMIMAPTLQASIAASQKDESQKHIPPDIVSDSGTPDVIPTLVFQQFWL